MDKMRARSGHAACLAAALAAASLVAPSLAHAQTPLEAFCADNVVALSKSSHESGLDPGTWASDPKNLARFGFTWPANVDTLYQSVIAAGPPAIKSFFSMENDRVEWRCEGQ